MDGFRHIDTWVFDLDNTLYDANTGVFDQIIEHMTQYVSDRLGISREEANALRRTYWQTYGTTLRGLMEEHKIDPYEFLRIAHDVDISDVPQCEVIKEKLTLLPGRKVIFTNSGQEFARRMTRHLGIDHHFEGTFTIEDANFLPKPRPETYTAIIEKFSFDPKKAAMFDDMQVNLKTAAETGMTTVWINCGEGSDGDGENGCEDVPPYIHHQTGKLADWLEQTVPQHPVKKK